MGDIEPGVWHKDGPVAQIEAMIEWLNDPLDAEHRRKVQKNLGASADALRGAVEALREYGGHRDDCPITAGAPDCDCGFDEAMLRALGRAGGR